MRPVRSRSGTCWDVGPGTIVTPGRPVAVIGIGPDRPHKGTTSYQKIVVINDTYRLKGPLTSFLGYQFPMDVKERSVLWDISSGLWIRILTSVMFVVWICVCWL